MTWANSVEPDQMPHCLLSALSEMVNYYPTTLESEIDPSFWQYFCEIPLGIYGFSLNNNNNSEKKNLPIAESLFKQVIKVAIHLCKNAFCDFIFQIEFCVEFSITKSTFLHHVGLEYSLLHWGRTLTRW